MGLSARALAFTVAGSLVLLACPSSPEQIAPPVPDAPTGLRVGLPDGWKATPFAGGLDVGPKGRVVLQLESSPRPLPAPDALASRLDEQKVQIIQKTANEKFIGIRYLLVADGGGDEGFVGVKRVGARTVWCATAARSSAAEVQAAMQVCLDVEARDSSLP